MPEEAKQARTQVNANPRSMKWAKRNVWQVVATLPMPMVRELDTVATSNGRSRSNQVRAILAEWLAEYRKGVAADDDEE